MDLIIDCVTLNDLEYDYNLFKMRTDCYSFARFEELFDSENEEDQVSSEMPFEMDWESDDGRVSEGFIIQ